MTRLMTVLLAAAWAGIVAAQAPAPRQNEVGAITQEAMQQRDYAGEQGKVNKSAPKPKLTDKQKAAEVSATTNQAAQQRDFAGEQAKVAKTPKPKLTDKQKAAEVDAATTQAAQQRDFPGEQKAPK
jgi:hypothetical protein